MKHNNIMLIKNRITHKNFLHAKIFYKKMQTNLLFDNFDKIVRGEFLDYILKDRNSNDINIALKCLSKFYFHSYSSEIIWNLLLLKKIIVDIRYDIEIFDKIENKIFYNDLNGLIELYDELSDVAQKSHKGIEILFHLNQLKLIEKMPEFEGAYQKFCSELYSSKIQDFVENSKLKKQIETYFGEKSNISNYIYYKVTQEKSEVNQLILFMNIDKSYNDIDFYESIVNFLIESSLNIELQNTAIKVIEEIYSVTKDKRLLTSIYSFKKKYVLDDEIIEQQMYFESELIGDYYKVNEITRKNIVNNKDDYTSLLFYMKSSIILGKVDNSVLGGSLIVNEIYRHLKVIFELEKGRIYYQAYTFLRYLDQYKMFSWSKVFYYYVFAYVDNFSKQNMDYFNFVYGYNYTFNPIRSYLYKNRSYDVSFPNSITFNCLISEENYSNSFPVVNESKISWLSLLQYSRSKNIDLDFNSSDEKILVFHKFYITVNKLLESNDINRALDLLTKRIVTFPEYYSLHPFNNVYLKVRNEDSFDPIQRLIILYYQIYAFDMEENEYRDLVTKARILLESILEDFDGCSRVEEFCNQYADLDKATLIFFLANVWRNEFMKNTLIYLSIDAIEEERINICTKLIELDPENKSIYIIELQERAKILEINKISSLLHTSKVFVDIASVKKNCLDRLDKSYESFKQLSTTSKQNQTIYLVKDDTDIGVLKDDEDNEGTEIDFDASVWKLKGHKFKAHKINRRILLKFRDIISDVTNEFLMGPAGLNSYLSTGIRHGILRNTLRNPLEESQLMPSLSDGTFYNKILEELPKNTLLYEKLKEFSKDIDSVIDTITERLIQISILYEFDGTSNNNVNGNVFNYYITFDETVNLIDQGEDDLSTLIDSLINLMWQKTDECLNQIKSVLDKSIKLIFLNIFKNLSDSLIDLGYSKQSEIFNSVVGAESNFFKVFNETLQWFNKKNVYKLPELQLSRCIEISQNIISRTIYNLKNWNDINLSINDDIFISGRYVNDLVYVFLDLFSNAYQHSKLDIDELSIMLDINHLNDRIEINFSNSINLNLIDINEVEENLLEIKDSIMHNRSSEIAQQDSNSGLHKIHNRLCNTILFRDTGIDFWIDTEESKFCVFIEFTIINKESV